MIRSRKALAGRRTPCDSSRGINVGRMPVASKCPIARPLLVDAFLHVLEDVLHHDRVLLHADDFGDVRSPYADRPSRRLAWTIKSTALAIC